MKLIKQLLALTFLLVFSSVIVNADSTEKQNRSVRDFSEISVSSGIDLYLTMGDEEKVTIVADDEIIDDIITEVRGDQLKIYLKERPFRFRWKWNQERKAYVTVKTIKEIKASAGSDVASENVIKGESLEVHASSGSDVRMEVNVNKLVLKASSGSDANLSGLAKYFDADASSGSDIRASDLKTKICRVEVSSGSDASVYATDEIEAHASSGGDIKYYGNPELRDIHESSGGDVHKR